MPKRTGKPQLEDGHTRLANELLEALMRYPFSAGEFRVLLAVIRLTYGWHRRDHPIAQQTLAWNTGLSQRQIKRILKDLRQQGVLFRDRTSRPHTFALNKAYLGWRDWSGCALSPQGDNAVPVVGDTGVPPLKESKERKEIEKKEKPYEPAVHNLLARFSDLLKRPLTAEEQGLVARLYELSPAQTHQLLHHVAHATGQTGNSSHQNPLGPMCKSRVAAL